MGDDINTKFCIRKFSLSAMSNVAEPHFLPYSPDFPVQGLQQRPGLLIKLCCVLIPWDS
ncbi:hypothetical protein DPMN_110804 [Dreissena polymorpha]|uniref:Uncharacterized protein n=1 Tax=Dreissena polymorpha TaxID=45954 RepID=A0A9D4KD97_DREPO|nr:hypothetical protein DPMN_110804 [Dreissena polymorpha]